MVPTDEGHGDVGRLEVVDLGTVVGHAGHVGSVDRFRQATPIQVLLHLLGDSMAVRGAVMEDRDLLIRPVIGKVVADHSTIRIVSVEDAEDVRAAQLGQQRVGGGR